MTKGMINRNDHLDLVGLRHFRFQINGFNERVPFYLEKLVLKFLKINLVLHPQFIRKMLSKFEHYHLLVSMDANNVFSNVFLTFCGLDRKRLKANLRRKKLTEYRKKKYSCYFSWKILAGLLKFLRDIGALLLGDNEQEKVLRLYVQDFRPKNLTVSTILHKLTSVQQSAKDDRELFRKFIQTNFLFKNLYFLLRKKSKKGSLQYKKFFYKGILEKLGLEYSVEEEPQSPPKDPVASGHTAVDVDRTRLLCTVDRLGRVRLGTDRPPEKPYVSVWVGRRGELTSGQAGIAVELVHSERLLPKIGEARRKSDF